MKNVGKYILLDPDEFESWLNMQVITRKVKLIQHHHTYIPDYSHFRKTNHFDLCFGMENSHRQRGFSEIAQNLTTFPDGKIMVCRNINVIPAGIKGANTFGICIENVGNFDRGGDKMKAEHRGTIILITKILLKKFKLIADSNTVVYHHWYDLTLGIRIKTEGTGDTKSCPGTAFFGGNTISDFKTGFLPLI